MTRVVVCENPALRRASAAWLGVAFLTFGLWDAGGQVAAAQDVARDSDTPNIETEQERSVDSKSSSASSQAVSEGSASTTVVPPDNENGVSDEDASWKARSPHDLAITLGILAGLGDAAAVAGATAGIGVRIGETYALQAVAGADLIKNAGLQMVFGLGLRNDDRIPGRSHLRGVLGAAPWMIEGQIVRVGMHVRMDYEYRTSEHSYAGFSVSIASYGEDIQTYTFSMRIGV